MNEIRFEEFRSYLRNQLPEARPLLAEMEEKEAEYAEEEGESPPTDAYGVMSEIFWWGIFEPALRGRNEGLIAECFNVVEELLRSGDENLVICLEVRVLDWLSSGDWIHESRRKAGPHLRSLLPQ